MPILLSLFSLPSVSCFVFMPIENTTLLEIIAKKNLKPRFKMNLDKISNRFMPEDPDYYEGLLMEGWWALSLSIFSLILLGFVLYLRIRYGYFGGKKLKNSEYTQFVRWTPGFLLTLSFLLFFVSGVSLLVESQNITDIANKLNFITKEFSMQTMQNTKYLNDNLINVNMMHVTDGLYFDVRDLQVPLNEAKFTVKSQTYFYEDILVLNNRRVVITLVIFCLGFIIFVIGIITLVLKIGSLGYTLAVAMGVLMSLNFLVLIPYIMQRVANLDFCEQILECYQENSIPVSGHEVGYYFSDFSQQTKSLLKKSEIEVGKMIIGTKDVISKFQSFSKSSSLGESLNFEEAIWLNTLVILENSENKMEKLASGYFIKKLCEDVSANVCSQSFGSFLLSEFSIVILAVSLCIGCLSGLYAPRVIERWKFEVDQLSLSKHNLYQLKQT